MDLSHIPIINYHKIEHKNDIGITSRRPDDFYVDMKILSDNGYQSITFQDLHNNTSFPKKPVIITFDDGYESVYQNAFPVMQEFGFTGIVFIPGLYIAKFNDWDVQLGNKKFRHLDSNQLSALSDAGFEIASHGMRHMPFTGLSDAELKIELAESKKILAKISRKPVLSICYPFGRFNTDIINHVRDAGYQYALSSLYFSKLCSKNIDFALKRFNIYRFDSANMFTKKLSSSYSSAVAIRDWTFQLGGRATAIYQMIKE